MSYYIDKQKHTQNIVLNSVIIVLVLTVLLLQILILGSSNTDKSVEDEIVISDLQCTP
jgi:membrane protein involved in colicin uptake